MVDLSIKDATVVANGGGGCGCGGCGCGGGGNEAQAAPVAVEKTCDCGPECTCGCNEGKPCTCGSGKADAGATVAQYTVTGMTCSHCTNAVTEEVSAIPGVTAVDVDLDSGSLKVTSDAPVDFDRIVEAVAEAGDYTVS